MKLSNNLLSENIIVVDEDYHTKNYYHECEKLYLEKIEIIKELENEDHEVIGYTLPNCQLDGKYGPVQTNSTM